MTQKKKLPGARWRRPVRGPLTDHAEFHPVDSAHAVSNEREADGGADDAVGGGNGKPQDRGGEQPDTGACSRRTDSFRSNKLLLHKTKLT